MKTLYFDNAATTPLDDRVREVMNLNQSDALANPSSVHIFGQAANAALDNARETAAAEFGAEFRSIIFTSGATEANNLVLRGVLKAFYRSFRSEALIPPRIIISGIEHDSVIHTAQDIAEEGAEVIIIPAEKNGIVSAKKIIEAINERTILVSVMTVNNETGAIQPIAEIGKAIRSIREERVNMKSLFSNSPYPIFHTDAVQAVRYMSCKLDELNADIITVSGHKIGGPRGVGALIMKPIGKYGLGKAIQPIIMGGGQEFGMRSGTENVSAIFGFGEAIMIAGHEREKNIKRVSEIKRVFWEEVRKYFPKAAINGPAEKEWGRKSVPHILNVWLPGYNSADIVTKCDMAGLAISYGSACGAKSFKPSHVLTAMGLSEKRVRESVRISFGPGDTMAEAKEGARRIKKALG